MINLIPESQMKSFGIYGIRNIVNNKYYIGQTTESFQDRFNRHNNNLHRNTHHNKHLQSSYNLYGADSFEFFVIEVCTNIDDLPVLEEVYIASYRSMFDCYNILAGGPTMCGENNPFYGKKHSKETLEKLSKLSVGKHTGEQNNFWGVDHSGENNGFYGHKHTDESRKKMSETKSKMYVGEGNPFYGKKHTEEAKAKMKETNRANAIRKVMCVETGIIYNSIQDAARLTGTYAGSISAVCNGRRNVANGLHWKHMSDRGSKELYT